MGCAAKKIAIIISTSIGPTHLRCNPLTVIAGKPILQHSYESALKAHNIQKVLVVTHDKNIADIVESFGGNYIFTSTELHSNIDSAIEAARHIDADLFINLQVDKYLINSEKIDILVEGMQNEATAQVGTLYSSVTMDEALDHSTVKVVLTKNQNALYFSRRLIPFGPFPSSIRYLQNLDIFAYRREMLGSYLPSIQKEDEDLECIDQLKLLTEGYSIRAYEVEKCGQWFDTAALIENKQFNSSSLSLDPKPLLSNIRLVITDVDGVLTDGTLYYDQSGEYLKCFHVRDGLGIKLLEESGIRVAVLSGRDSPPLRKRIQDLGIELFQLGVKDKMTACEQLIAKAGVTAIETACIGDDSIDLPAFEACGISYAVADAPKYVKSAADHTLTTSGGKGALRELADAILEAQGKSKLLTTAKGYSKVMTSVVQ